MSGSPHENAPSAPVLLTGERLALRPWGPADGPELNRIVALPEVARWWAPEDFTRADDEACRYTIVVEGAVRGLVQFYEETDPDYRHAMLDIFLDPAVRGRGLGVEAVLLLIRWLFEARGHHRVTIDPALDNEAAIRAYEKAGFRRVGVLREFWRDHADGVWRDGLLLDLLRRDLPG